MYVATVSRLANTSSADYMQLGKTAKLNDGDSLSAASHSSVNVQQTTEIARQRICTRERVVVWKHCVTFAFSRGVNFKTCTKGFLNGGAWSIFFPSPSIAQCLTLGNLIPSRSHAGRGCGFILQLFRAEN